MAVGISLLIHEYPSPVIQMCDGTQDQEAGLLSCCPACHLSRQVTCQQLRHKALQEMH
jgi:hypothetical protein